MSTSRIIAVAILFVAMFIPNSQFAQNPGSDEDHWSLLALLRTINTLEATDLNQYGSYEPWPTLLDRHVKDLNGWAAKQYSRGNTHFAQTPEVLPGWNLRLNVQPDGQSYVVVLEDAKDKTGYAALSDERGIIRECKYIR
jgi:hypothetical protein